MSTGTGEARLVEHTVNDSYWGDDGGRNRLGEILMSVREELRGKGESASCWIMTMHVVESLGVASSGSPNDPKYSEFYALGMAIGVG